MINIRFVWNRILSEYVLYIIWWGTNFVTRSLLRAPTRLPPVSVYKENLYLHILIWTRWSPSLLPQDDSTKPTKKKKKTPTHFTYCFLPIIKYREVGYAYNIWKQGWFVLTIMCFVCNIVVWEHETIQMLYAIKKKMLVLCLSLYNACAYIRKNKT